MPLVSEQSVGMHSEHISLGYLALVSRAMIATTKHSFFRDYLSMLLNCAYLITVVFYQFFNSVNNVKMFIFVVMSNVSSVEPAVTVDCLRSGFWVVEVTCKFSEMPSLNQRADFGNSVDNRTYRNNYRRFEIEG